MLQAYGKLVEIRTKVASVFPFLLGTLYAFYRYRAHDPANFVLMLVSLLCLDMATTAINNYMDHRTAQKKTGYGYLQHNAMVRYGISSRRALLAIGFLLAVSVLFGIWLFLRTDWLVLLLGALAFVLGITYTFGPMPTSRTPFSEVISGVAMGFLIPFLACYVHIWRRGWYRLELEGTLLRGSLDLRELFCLGLFALPSVVGIANIMLANNICDREEDRENGRFTLPISIGLRKSLALFAVLYGVGFASIPWAVWEGAAPVTYLLSLGAAWPVVGNIRRFWSVQSKERTFALSVKSYVLMEGVRLVCFALGMWL